MSFPGDTYAHCSLCPSDFSVSHGGRNDVTTHWGGKRHKQAEKDASASRSVRTQLRQIGVGGVASSSQSAQSKLGRSGTRRKGTSPRAIRSQLGELGAVQRAASLSWSLQPQIGQGVGGSSSQSALSQLGVNIGTENAASSPLSLESVKSQLGCISATTGASSTQSVKLSFSPVVEAVRNEISKVLARSEAQQNGTGAEVVQVGTETETPRQDGIGAEVTCGVPETGTQRNETGTRRNEAKAGARRKGTATKRRASQVESPTQPLFVMEWPCQ